MYTVRYKNTSIRVLLTIFPPRDYLHSVRRLKSYRDSPVSFNFKDRKSDSLVKFLFNSFAHIVYTQAFTDSRILTREFHETRGTIFGVRKSIFVANFRRHLGLTDVRLRIPNRR